MFWQDNVFVFTYVHLFTKFLPFQNEIQVSVFCLSIKHALEVMFTFKFYILIYKIMKSVYQF